MTGTHDNTQTSGFPRGRQAVVYRIERDRTGRVICSAHGPTGKHQHTETPDQALGWTYAEALHQVFKWAFIAPRRIAPSESYEITGREIAAWADAQRSA